MHRLTAICVRHPWVTAGLSAFISVFALVAVLSTEMAVGTDATLGADHSAVREFDEFLERFSGGYPILIGYECSPGECESALDPVALKMASRISRSLEKAPSVSRVSSLATSRLLVASPDFGIDARQLVVNGRPVEDRDLLASALEDPLWSGTLISPDGRVGAIVVELASTTSEALSEVIAEIRRETAPFEDEFRFYLAGEAVLFVESQEDGLSSAATAGAITGGMLFLILLLLIRSFPVVVATLLTIGVASTWTMGFLPLLGWKQSELTNGAATLILVIGCADCIHFAARFLGIRGQFASPNLALEAAACWVLAPCLVSTITTAAAFGSFAAGGVIALPQFGTLSAIGIVLVFLLTFSLFPALLLLLKATPRALEQSSAWQEVLSRLSRLSASRSRLVLGLSLGLALLGAAGIPKLEVEMSISELWSPDHSVMRAIDFVSENLQRADRLEIGLALPEGRYLEQPDVIGTVSEFERELQAIPRVSDARSLITVLRHANRLLRPEADELPTSEAGIAELLFLTSGGAAGSLDPWVTIDQQNLRLSAGTEDLPMREKDALLRRVRGALQALPEGWDTSLTGPVVLTSRYGVEFRRGQVVIIVVSSVLVCAMIGIYLRSLPWAVLAILPNAIALLLLFGTMGHWGIHMNFGSAIVAPIAIGIATDDTVHFLAAYARERRSNLAPVAAVGRAITGVGEPVIATAIALCLGFASMVVSPMASVADMGLLCAIAIAGATLADLLLLPALIATMSRWRGFQELPGKR
jgi:predicted RND superfamily exporter protein